MCSSRYRSDTNFLQHFRNFQHEMPRRAKHLGFEELSPNKTANELFGHLGKGDKVAIISRFSTSPTLQQYLEALERRGIQARVITGQDGTEDFCFLMHAQRAMVGTAQSSYLQWAAFLGSPTKAVGYSVDSPSRRRRHGGKTPFYHFNYTHPDLASRFSFELYKAE